MTKKANPLRAIFNVRRDELPLTILMFGYFFMTITTFWILKPLKKPLMVNLYSKERPLSLLGFNLGGAQAELVAKVLNMFVAYFATVAFTSLSNRFRREQLTYIFSAFFAVGFIAFSVLLGGSSPPTVWGFYLYGDLYNTVMLASFFAFLNDSVTPEAARRIYGPVVLGGVVGGAFGSTFVRVWIERLSTSGWMWVCLAITVAIVAVAYAAGRVIQQREHDQAPSEIDASHKQPQSSGKNPALEGAKLVLGSRYLLAIVAVVGLYEIVSTVLDFQFTSTTAHYAPGESFGKHIATVYMITNISGMLIQLLLTSFVMSRFRLTVALLVLPISAMAGSLAFVAFPILWIGSYLSVGDNAFQYSINQSAKEALYTPATREQKYKAKAFIDMFVQRFAKAIAVGVSLIITLVFTDFSAVRWLSIFTLVVLALWITAARYGGRRFHELTDG